MTTKKFMAIDQYGETFHGLIHPRKDLCERLCSSHVDKQYTEYKDGHSEHTGYIIAGHWLTVYEVKPFKTN